MSLWNPTDTVRDVAESVGIVNLHEDIAKGLAQDVEFRLSMIIQEALKFMRHSRRTTLTTADISNALRALDVEPLYGYESTRPLKFGEAPLGPGQPLYYVEDEEVDFEKLVNAPLPKVPREVSFTAHWLAVEGKQPEINQNPTITSESGAKGMATSHSIAAMAGTENASVKPLVKHVLSKELQIYFDKVTEAALDKENESLRIAAFTSLRNDPGLHQLLPYFVQFIRENVTHGLLDLFVLRQMMELTESLLYNEHLFLDPYITSIVPAILTCLIAKRLGPETVPSTSSYPLREYAASLVKLVTERFGEASHTLKSRLARTFLKHFLDNNKPYGTYYGSILGLCAVGGGEAVRVLIMPNVKSFEEFIRDDIIHDTAKKIEADMCLAAIGKALLKMKDDDLDLWNKLFPDNNSGGEVMDLDSNDELKSKLANKIGDLAAEEIMKTGDMKLAKIIVKASDAIP